MIATQIHTYAKNSQLFFLKLFIDLYLDNENYKQFTQYLFPQEKENMALVYCKLLIKLGFTKFWSQKIITQIFFIIFFSFFKFYVQAFLAQVFDLLNYLLLCRHISNQKE